MNLPAIKIVENKTEKVTVAFKGLNHMPVVSDGEFKDMQNLSSQYEPCLYPRPSREIIRSLTYGTTLFASNGKLVLIDDTNFIYDGSIKGTVTSGIKSICEYFGVILIFPDKKYFNYNTNTFGSISNCPDIKYACVHNNRVFGVGGNGFYASKLGDPLTWNDFPVPITVGCSWQTNTGEEGDFTGIIATQSYVVAVKENHLYELYNDRPSNFALKEVVSSGCIDNRSLIAIDSPGGGLFMLGKEGIKIYTGGIPKIISTNLDENYVSGAAGTDGRRYYISLYNESKYNLYVYDTQTELWHKEDELNIFGFANTGNSLYAMLSGTLYKFSSGSESVNWYGVLEFTERYLGKKVNSKIKLTADLEYGSFLNVLYSIDDGDFITLKSFDRISGYKTISVDIIPGRADKFCIKLSGTGQIKIYELSREMTYGSSVNANNSFAFTISAMESYKISELEQIKISRLDPAGI